MPSQGSSGNSMIPPPRPSAKMTSNADTDIFPSPTVESLTMLGGEAFSSVPMSRSHSGGSITLSGDDHSMFGGGPHSPLGYRKSRSNTRSDNGNGLIFGGADFDLTEGSNVGQGNERRRSSGHRHTHSDVSQPSYRSRQSNSTVTQKPKIRVPRRSSGSLRGLPATSPTAIIRSAAGIELVYATDSLSSSGMYRPVFSPQHLPEPTQSASPKDGRLSRSDTRPQSSRGGNSGRNTTMPAPEVSSNGRVIHRMRRSGGAWRGTPRSSTANTSHESSADQASVTVPLRKPPCGESGPERIRASDEHPAIGGDTRAKGTGKERMEAADTVRRDHAIDTDTDTTVARLDSGEESLPESGYDKMSEDEAADAEESWLNCVQARRMWQNPPQQRFNTTQDDAPSEQSAEEENDSDYTPDPVFMEVNEKNRKNENDISDSELDDITFITAEVQGRKGGKARSGKALSEARLKRSEQSQHREERQPSEDPELWGT